MIQSPLNCPSEVCSRISVRGYSLIALASGPVARSPWCIPLRIKGRPVLLTPQGRRPARSNSLHLLCASRRHAPARELSSAAHIGPCAPPAAPSCGLACCCKVDCRQTWLAQFPLASSTSTVLLRGPRSRPAFCIGRIGDLFQRGAPSCGEDVFILAYGGVMVRRFAPLGESFSLGSEMCGV